MERCYRVWQWTEQRTEENSSTKLWKNDCGNTLYSRKEREHSFQYALDCLSYHSLSSLYFVLSITSYHHLIICSSFLFFFFSSLVYFSIISSCIHKYRYVISFISHNTYRNCWSLIFLSELLSSQFYCKIIRIYVYKCVRNSLDSK